MHFVRLLTQFSNLLLNQFYQFQSLKKFILAKCSQSIHFALQVITVINQIHDTVSRPICWFEPQKTLGNLQRRRKLFRRPLSSGEFYVIKFCLKFKKRFTFRKEVILFILFVFKFVSANGACWPFDQWRDCCLYGPKNPSDCRSCNPWCRWNVSLSSTVHGHTRRNFCSIAWSSLGSILYPLSLHQE